MKLIKIAPVNKAGLHTLAAEYSSESDQSVHVCDMTRHDTARHGTARHGSGRVGSGRVGSGRAGPGRAGRAPAAPRPDPT